MGEEASSHVRGFVSSRERDRDEDGADEWGLNCWVFLPLKTKRDEREMTSSSERGQKKKAVSCEARETF